MHRIRSACRMRCTADDRDVLGRHDGGGREVASRVKRGAIRVRFAWASLARSRWPDPFEVSPI